MAVYFFIVFGSLFLLTGSALLALRWAARTGQLRHFQKTALSIFDDEEPVGQMTDAFPGRRPIHDGLPPTPGAPTASSARSFGNPTRGQGAPRSAATLDRPAANHLA
ncbi:MAG: hypothetical protein KGS61_14730 [Verrucomicrobia bacterium]|nr:hypothetical protein [Verrucomicrobiota bacterium]